jgi:phenylacetate-coenzyme A ligase PaaK-like adenylate-forming protein
VIDILNLFDVSPFSLTKDEKTNIYLKALRELTNWHYENCLEYRKILDFTEFDVSKVTDISEFPFIPVRLFKEYDLLSMNKADIVKTMTSSGTTGQKVSKIYLDKTTSTNQTKALVKIISSFTGKKRLPMLVIDSSSVLKDRNLFSARGAGILGFSMIGHDLTYALDDQMNIDVDQINYFLNKHGNETILLFGFTFMIWRHFYEELQRLNIRLPLENSLMIHGGGWKKLISQSVDNSTFKKKLNEAHGISKIFDYYGMVEQTGSIFMECEFENFHASVFSDILIRDVQSFQNLSIGKMGLIQLVSLLPNSYPGHSILTEDLGEILGEDDCRCGRKGKYFKVYGRIKNAEIRGCSDTYN